MNREKLIRSQGYNVTKIQSELYRELTSYLAENNMTQSEFAKQLNVSKGYISQVLNGNFDYKLSKLVELSLAIGKVPKIEFVPISNACKKENITIQLSIPEHKIKNTPISTQYSTSEFDSFGLKKVKIAQ